MLHYILQTIVFQLLFLMVYDLFLKNETFFNWNRFYLLVSAVLSIILPFVKIDAFKTVIPERYIYTLPEVILGKSSATAVTNEALLNTAGTVSSVSFNWSYLIYLGCAIALVLFTIKFYKLIVMAYKNPKVKFEKAFLVELVNSKHAFSFFNYIFLGRDINTEDRQSILEHELQHVKEKHSLDLLFFEILKIIFWFNPLVYMYQKRIANLHEFVADSKAVKSTNKVSYYQNLLSQVFDTKKVSFINPFFKQSLIKKRIIMLSKSKSKQIHLAKYLLVFPMVIGMLFYTSCSNDEKINQNVEVNSSLSEEELVEKYLKEVRILSNDDYFYNIKNDKTKPYHLILNSNNYLENLDEFARHKAFKINGYERFGSKASEDSVKLSWSQTMLTKIRDKNYETYLAKKKTEKSMKDWENTSSDGKIRKLVVDLDNISIEEQKIIDDQVVRINNDSYYHTQIISDGLRHEKREFKTENNNEEIIGKQMSFAVIGQVPAFPGCDTSVSNDEQRKCFSDKINKIVIENFDLDLGKTLGLVGKQKIYVRFTINKEGNITNVKSRAPHPELEREARRVVKLIPQVEPGKQDGELINVTFDLPIRFNVLE